VESLTKAETTVLLSLLGANWNETERSRIRASGIPRSTYQEAKRRLYLEGYLTNRFVPDPHALGMGGFRFLVARPFVDAMAPVARALADDPHTVTLWVGATALFAVQLAPNAGGAPSVSEPSRDVVPGTVVRLTAANRPDQIPVFFDMEGTWSRVAGAPGPRGYPRGLPCPSGLGSETHAPLSPRNAVALRELLARPFDTALGARGVALVAAPFLPRSQRHVLAQDWATWRILLSFAKRLAYGERELRQLILISGSLKPGVRLSFVTSALARRTGSAPFLAASDGSKVLLGALGGLGARSPSGSTGSVLGTLQATLSDLQIVREELSTLETRLDLRFDRIQPKPFMNSPTPLRAARKDQ
jgi:hypothetical protein